MARTVTTVCDGIEVKWTEPAAPFGRRLIRLWSEDCVPDEISHLVAEVLEAWKLNMARNRCLVAGAFRPLDGPTPKWVKSKHFTFEHPHDRFALMGTDLNLKGDFIEYERTSGPLLIGPSNDGGWTGICLPKDVWTWQRNLALALGQPPICDGRDTLSWT